MKNKLLCLCAIIGSWLYVMVAAQSEAQEQRPLPNAHAHNDYLHERPLLDALEHGFTSVEADIFLVDGDLLVAHFLKDVRPGRTLDKLYLRPLYERFRQYGSSVFPVEVNLTLLIDIKSQGQATYEVLRRQLEPYVDMLSVTRDGTYTQRAVTIIISGDRPIEAITASNPRYVGIDGRLSDLDSDQPAWLFPLISDNWRVHFRYRDEDQMAEDERRKLLDIVRKAHQKGRRVRFWATPESEDMWRHLRAAEVDLIGTDDLQRLENHLRKLP